MRDLDPKDEPAPVLGKPIRSEPTPPPAPTWKTLPNHPKYQRNEAGDVQAKPGVLMPASSYQLWGWWLRGGMQ